MNNRFLDAAGLARIGHMEFVARQVVEGFISGRHRSPYHGFSVEYADHRPYAPGDEPRMIDWKVLARSDKYYVKLFEEETNLRAHLLLDASRSMAFKWDDRPDKFTYGAFLSAALAFLLIRQNDAVGLSVFDSKVRTTLPPRSAPIQFRRILDALGGSASQDDTSIAPVLHELADRVRGRGLVILISDMIDDVDAMMSGLQHLRHRRHEVVVFHLIDPAEREFPFERASRFQDMEGAGRLSAHPRALRAKYLERFEAFLDRLANECHRNRIAHHLVSTDEPYERFLGEFLEKRAAARMTSLFLNPFLWPFLAAAAAPIILHLLSLRRLPLVELSTFRFLFDTYVQQRRRLRLLEYLLLLLRILFLLLLVLALMRPTQTNWSSLFGLGGGRSVVLVVDCSASMNAKTAGVSSLERAREAAAAVLDNLSPSDRVTLVRLVQRPEVVLSRFAANAVELRTAVANLKPSISGGNAHAALSAAIEEERRHGRSVYLVTDLQKTGWKQVLDQPGGLSFGDDKLFVVNVGGKDRLANAAVLGDAPADSDAVVGQPVELKPRVGNFGDRAIDLTLRVEIDGRQVGAYSVSVLPGKTTSRAIVYVPTKPGPLRGSYKIERDPFDADDEFQFVLNVARPVRVLLVNGKSDPDPFKDEIVFLRAALKSRFEAAEAPSTIFDAFRPLDAGSLELEEVRDGEWNAERLQGVDLVVFANAQNFNDDNLRALKAYVRAGGGLLLFPGDRVTNRWRELFESQRNDTPLLPVRLEGPWGDENRRERFDRFAAIDYGHPIFSVFRPAEGAEYLTTPRFFKRYKILLNPGDRRCFTLAQFANREPAVVEGKFGKGVVVVSAFPVSGEWSTLPLVGADFVPLALRMVSYARRKPELRTPSATTSGADASVSAADRLEDPVCTVIGPQGARRGLPLSRGSDEWIGKVEASDRGYYRVELDARDPAPIREDRSDSRPSEDRRFHAEAGFAVNIAEQESDFTRLTSEDLRKSVGSAATLVDLSGAGEGVAEALTQKREIWRWLMYALGIVFVAEFLLATLRGPRTAAETALDAEQGGWTSRLTGVKEMTKLD